MAVIEMESKQKVDEQVPSAQRKQKAFYEENGYLILEDAVSADEVETLRQELISICKCEHGEIPGRIGNEADLIDGQLEGKTDDEILERFLCIHFPHKVSAVFKKALAFRSVVRGLTTVIGPNVKCMQSMLFVKSSGKPGQAWHQDEIYIPTRDRSLTGAWIAMDDAHIKNGCLWVIPGSHRPGILWPQRQHNDRNFDCARETYSYPYSEKDAVPVEVKKGTAVLFNGYLLHRSLPNRASSGFRRCLVNHYMSAESFLPWHRPAEGQSMGNLDFRDVVIVAGRDPYEFNGYKDLSRIHVRPSGKGGCGNNEHNVAQKL